MRSVRSAKWIFSRLAEVADVVERSARGRADEGVNRRAELDERVRQVRTHEAVGARDEHGAVVVHVAELLAEIVQRCGLSRECRSTWSVRFRVGEQAYRLARPGLAGAAAALTATSLIVVSGFAALVGVVIAREFGRTEETDGFFAAYGVFVVIVTARTGDSRRRAPVRWREPARTRTARRPICGGFATALALVGAAARPRRAVRRRIGSRTLLTGDGSGAAQRSLRGRASVGRARRGRPPLRRSGGESLAALDDYATPAARVRGRQRAGLASSSCASTRTGSSPSRGGWPSAAWWALVIPLVVLAWRARRTSMPASAARPAGEPLRHRLGTASRGCSHPARAPARVRRLPPVRRAPRLGCGDELRLRVPRRDDRRRHHRVLDRARLVGAAVSHRPHPGCGRPARRRCIVGRPGARRGGGRLLALAGAQLVEAFLGAAYGDEVGDEVAALIVVFSAWMVVAVGVNVTFPLAFVTDRLRALPWIGVAALAVQLSACLDRCGAFPAGRPCGLPCALDAARARRAPDPARCSATGTSWHRVRGGRRRRLHGCGVRAAGSGSRRSGERARRPRGIRSARSRGTSARPQGVVGLPPRALARLPPFQSRAAPIELDERETGARAEKAMTGGRHYPLGGW